MALLAPPPAPPQIATSDDDGARRFRLRAFQLSATMVTLLATVWVCTLGIFPAIIGLSIAKHVLVAILMMGLGVDAPREQ
jgi:hypothetical protein